MATRVEPQHSHATSVLIADPQALPDHAGRPQESGADGVLLESRDSCTPGAQPAVKDEIRQKGFGGEIPAGFLTYPVSQAADIMAFKAHLVPVGADQLPMIEQTVEIVRRFNRIYGSILVEPEALVPRVSRLPGTDARVKMSKPLANAIYLSDLRDIVSEKVMRMYTDPRHVRIQDPGRVEGDVEIKHHLIDVLHRRLAPIRARRQNLARDPEQILRILREGPERGRAVARDTVAEAPRAMHLDYQTAREPYKPLDRRRPPVPQWAPLPDRSDHLPALEQWSFVGAMEF